MDPKQALCIVPDNLNMLISPPYSSPSQVITDLAEHAFAVLPPTDVAQYLRCELRALLALQAWWDNLPLDVWLKDGGRYRRRRHSCFIVSADSIQQSPHRAHWQPVQYNALHGGLNRMFEPMEDGMVACPTWHLILSALANTYTVLSGHPTWYVEAHVFRIDTTNGIGRPTPEGAHRDGVDFVSVFLVNRHNVTGGESRVFDAESSQGTRFTLQDDWTLLMLDDARVLHESTPIQPLAADGHRDTLVLTWRHNGFQSE